MRQSEECQIPENKLDQDKEKGHDINRALQPKWQTYSSMRLVRTCPLRAQSSI
jgi:hypothetical protein